MSGYLLQLVAVGAQDSYLMGGCRPISFFDYSYNKHTNFSMNTVSQTVKGPANFGNTVQITIDRNGDLLKDVLLKITLPRLYCDQTAKKPLESGIEQIYLNSIGNALIKKITLKIGGQEIQSFNGEWLEIWSELNLPPGKYEMHQEMVKKFDTTTAGKSLLSLVYNQKTISFKPYKYQKDPLALYIPIPFWFTKDPSLALPLIALQYHQVVIDITFRELEEVILVSNKLAEKYRHQDLNNQLVKMINVEFYSDYVYLDSAERHSFASQPKEYLIEQVQKNTCLFFADSEKISVPLVFNHPVKEFYWVFNKNNDRLFNSLNDMGRNIASKNYQDYSFETAELFVNGMTRFGEREAEYFDLVQPWKYHTRHAEGINSFSFALHPEKYQPSGSFNFSRLNSAKLNFKLNPSKNEKNGVINVYALNYNILKIISGMGGLLFND